jgi:hypothetical protein
MDAMTKTNKNKQQPEEPSNSKWRYWLGLALFILSYPVLYGTLFAAPFLTLTVKEKALMISVAAAVSYALWALSLPLLGREIFDVLKRRYAVWRRVRRLRRNRNGKAES